MRNILIEFNVNSITTSQVDDSKSLFLKMSIFYNI